MQLQNTMAKYSYKTCKTTTATQQLLNTIAKQKMSKNKLSQQKTLREGGLEFKAANQCSDFLNQFKKSPDALCTSNRLGGDAKKAKEENAL